MFVARSILLIVAVACLAALAAPTARAAEPANAVAFEAKRGLNLSHWFSQLQGGNVFGTDYVAKQLTDDEFKAIRALGFDHVRLPVEPELMSAADGSGALDTSNLELLQDAVRRLLAANLKVIVDAHPKKAFKEALQSDPAAVEAAARWWRDFAAALAWTDPTKVALQLVNEPMFKDAAAWQATQQTLAAAARQGAPKHTLIATGHSWSDVADLAKLTPLADKNVLYAFHMYRSTVFTHQGANWGNALWKDLKHVPYPSSPEAVAPLLADLPEGSRKLLEEYGQKNFGPQSIRDTVATAADWADAHGVRLICTEFGVYRPFADADDRAEWLRDARTAFEERGVAWSMWDYKHGFGLVNTDGGPAVSEKNLTALGLSRKDVPSWLVVTD